MDTNELIESYKDEIQKLLKMREDASDRGDSIVINEDECENVPIGASKMGGLPDLPSGIPYPELAQFVTELGVSVKSIKGFGDTKTPVVSSLIELVGKVLIAWLLVPVTGYYRIIVSEPVVWSVMVIPLLFGMRKFWAVCGENTDGEISEYLQDA